MRHYKILFIDLDDTLIKTISAKGTPSGIYDMQLRFDTLNAIRNMQPDVVFIVTNQGGIECGYVNEDNFNAKLEYLHACIREYCDLPNKVASAYCRTTNSHDKLRKPNTGMFDLAMHLMTYVWHMTAEDTSKSNCLMVGDSSGKPTDWSSADIDFANNCGIDYLDVEDFIAQFAQ